MSDRPRQNAQEQIDIVIQALRQRCPTLESMRGAFAHQLSTSETLRYAAATVLCAQALDGRGQVNCAPELGRTARALPSSPNSDAGGHTNGAGLGHACLAPASEPNPDESGQACCDATSDHAAAALLSGPERDGEGHRASSGQPGHPEDAAPSLPPKPMSPSLREALRGGRRSAARDLMFALHDGKDIMSVRMGELPAYRALGARQAAICNRILNHAANASPDQNVGDVITTTTLQLFIAETDKGLRHAGI